MAIFSYPKFTDWRISGSAGLTIQIETPVVNLSIGASYLMLPLENTKTSEKVDLHMVGGTIGAGVGESIFGVVDIEGSLPCFPSDGYGKMAAGFRGSPELSASEFTGNKVMFVSVGYKSVGGASVCAIACIKPGWDMLAAAVIPGPSDDLLWAHCGGLFYGSCLGTGVSVGVTYAEYVVATVSQR